MVREEKKEEKKSQASTGLLLTKGSAFNSFTSIPIHKIRFLYIVHFISYRFYAANDLQ